MTGGLAYFYAYQRSLMIGISSQVFTARSKAPQGEATAGLFVWNKLFVKTQYVDSGNSVYPNFVVHNDNS